MYRRKILLMLSALTVGIIAIAAPRTAEQAKKIAAEQARKLGINAASPQMTKTAPRRSAPTGQDGAINGAEGLTTGENCYYYVFNNGENKGFTIVSGDDLMPEIVGYSDKGSFSEENMPANMKSFLKAYEQTLDKVAEGDAKAIKIVEELKARRAASTGAYTVGDILLGNIQWNQTEPYNLLCPTYLTTGGYKHCATGCGATAMAQIMMYHKWPKELTVDIPDYITDYYGIRKSWEGVKVEPEGHPYDWDNMLENYGTQNYTNEQALAVAQLMSDVGRAVKMEYGPESTSYSNMPFSALTTYFDYDPDIIQMINRQFVSLAQWTEIIKKDINERRPVFYYGTSNSGGHMFVCDGYDSNDFFHINWGWGGLYDGFFDITILNPYNSEDIGASNTLDGFDMMNSIIVGIQPNNGIEDKPQWDFPVLSADIIQEHKITKAERQNKNDIFILTPGMIIRNLSGKTFSGDIGFANIDNDGNMTIIGYFSAVLKPNYYAGPLESRYAFPVGKNTVVAVERPNGSSEWRMVNGAMANALSLVVTENSLSIAEPELLDINVLSKEITAGSGDVEVEITNNTGKDYYGRIYVFVTDTKEEFEAEKETGKLTSDNTIPLGLDQGQSIKKNVTLTTYDTNKEFWLTFCDDNGYVLGSTAVTTIANPEPMFVITGYSIDGKEITSESEIVRLQTNLGIFDMAFVHNTAAPKVAIHVKNVGTDGTFSASLYNECDATGNPLLYYDKSEAVNLEIPAGETRDITSISANEGKSINLWTLQRTSTPLIIGDVPFGQVFNNGEFFLIYAYNDGTAGISVPVVELETTGKIYNTRGQRVKTPSEKGIYIIGRKKVLVK